MGVASMIIGIIAVIFAFIPCVGWFAFLPAIVGFVLGLVDIVQKKKNLIPCGMGIAGVVCNAIAIILIILWVFVFAVAGAAASA